MFYETKYGLAQQTRTFLGGAWFKTLDSEIEFKQMKWELPFYSKVIAKFENGKYQYRNLPCTIGNVLNEIYFVEGTDSEQGSGILEWCYSQKDAQNIILLMNKESGRFTDLQI